MPVHLSSSLKAPRLHARRIARLYSFPWAQLLFTTILTLFSGYIGTPKPLLIGWWLTTFFCFIMQDLAAPYSLLTTFVYWLNNKVGLRPQYRADLARTKHVFSLYPAAPLFLYRYPVRWILPLIVLLSTWIFAVYQSRVELEEYFIARAVLTTFLLAFGFIPYGILIADRMKYATRFKKYVLWLSLGIIGAAAGAISFWNLTSNLFIVMLSTLVFFIIYTTVFITQRLWVGERDLNEVLRSISLDFLALSQVTERLTDIPAFIGDKLQHDRVFILEPTSGEKQLCVTGEYTDSASVRGQMVPIDDSITGKVYTEKESIVWNEVDACPYYHQITAKDDTQAEIAVPIMHQDNVYAVLDVQSKRKRIYGPGDLQVLEAVARILGASIAVERRELLFGEAVHLWERLATATTMTFASEKAVFDLFAQFAQEMLGADLVIYFSLSLAGCPTRAPYRWGRFHYPDLLEPPINDPASSLIQLISDWKSYYESVVTADSLVAQSASPGKPGFVERELIRSTCFIPIGMKRERLGALFLNFRKPVVFDTMFRFTILSLAQSLAQVTAHVRYREILFESFGRPELGLHSILGRHGLKEGVLRKANRLQCQSEAEEFNSVKDRALYTLLVEMELFLQEIRLSESSIPPNFWQESLADQLLRYTRTLPSGRDGRRSKLQLNVDSQVERESPWVKLALYRVITEAVNNAVFHASATKINILVRREPHTIEATVTNDGTPLPDFADRQQSSNGIFALLQECREKLGADARIRKAQQTTGTVVTILLPALPIDQIDQEE